MMALTLHQPYAMFVETGYKEIETRNWYTSYRGPLAIHSSKRWTQEMMFQMDQLLLEASLPIDLVRNISMGCVVATCHLVACIPTDDVERTALKLKPAFEPRHGWEIERKLGNYERGRWAWVLRDVEAVLPHVPARGYRKLWAWQGIAGPVH